MLYFDPYLVSVVIRIIGVIATFYYIVTIFQGKTKPHCFSWLIWGLIATIIFLAQYKENAGPGIWGAGMIAGSCLIVLILSFRYGEKDIARSDWAILCLCLMAIIPWVILHDAFWSVVLVTFIDALAYIPTIRKCWSKPHEESLFYYITVSVIFGLSLISLTNFTFTTALYPFVIGIVNTIFISGVLFRRFKLQKP